MYKKYIKRLLDFVLSLIGLIILSPVFLVVAILVKCSSKGPVFFRQERLGKDGKVFKIIKFRTMINNAEKLGTGLRITGQDDFRITKIGGVLRKLSLDELPQLINVLIGNMSLVGPRPPVTYFPHKYEEYDEIQQQRFYVRPGITGLAQVKVRNNATWDKRIEIDVEYVKNLSFINDLKILFETVFKLLKNENIYEEKSVKTEVVK